MNIFKCAERPHNHDLRCQAPQVMAAMPHLQHFRMCVPDCCFELVCLAHAKMYMNKKCIGYWILVISIDIMLSMKSKHKAIFFAMLYCAMLRFALLCFARLSCLRHLINCVQDHHMKMILMGEIRHEEGSKMRRVTKVLRESKIIDVMG